MKKQILSLALVFFTFTLSAQVGINNTDPKAKLDITASNVASPTATDGILIPRIDDFPNPAPLADQDGMMVFVTGNGTPAKGFYYWDSSIANWETVAGVKNIDELLDGKSDNDGSQNGSSIFLGVNAGANDNGSNNKNIGFGFEALNKNTVGNNNTAIGYQTLYNNSVNAISDGNNNVAIGNVALFNNISGSFNTATGVEALLNNEIGDGNVSYGARSLHNSTMGYWNVAIGIYTLYSNETGNENTAIGTSALLSNSGNGNVAIGYNAGYNETGSNKLYIENSNANANNALIYGEFDTNLLRFNGHVEMPSTADTNGTTGSGVLEIGGALRLDGNEIITNTDSPLYLQGGNNGDLVVDSGTLAVDASTNRVGVGTTTPDYKFSVNGLANLNEGVAIGPALFVNGSEALWYNGTYFSWGYGGTANFFQDNVGIGTGKTNPTVALDVNGDIHYTGTIADVSDRRLKENFKPINNTLEALQKIKGYTYNMKNDVAKKREYGVIAQDVQKVFPEMVSIIDDEGHFGVSYIQLIPVLVEAIKDQQTIIEKQNLKNKSLEKRLEKLEAFMQNNQRFIAEVPKTK